MKTAFLVLTVFIAMVYSDTESDYWEQCKDEMGITEDIFENLNLDDPKIKCLFACALKKMNVIVDGKVTHDVEMDYPVSDYTEQHITECINKANEQNNECDMAVTLYKCIVG